MAQRKRTTRVQIGERNDHGGMPEDNRDAMGHASLLAGHLLVLASGVGGSRGGRVEGNLAVSAVLTHFRTATDNSVQRRLDSAMDRANDVLAARASRNPALQGTGASCAAVLLHEGRCYAARTGDARVFVIRGEFAEELLVDPSDDVGPVDDALATAQSTGVLGAGPGLRRLSTESPLELLAGDRLMLAGPGLHRYVSIGDLARIATSAVPQVASGRLVDTARQRGARGGVSVQIIQWSEPEIRDVGASVAPLRVPDTRPATQVTAPAAPSISAGTVRAPSSPPATRRSAAAASRASLGVAHAEPPAIPVRPAIPGRSRAAAPAVPAAPESIHTTGDFDVDFEEAFGAPTTRSAFKGLLRSEHSASLPKWGAAAAAAAAMVGLWVWAPWQSNPAESESTTPVAVVDTSASDSLNDYFGAITSLPGDDPTAELEPAQEPSALTPPLPAALMPAMGREDEAPRADARAAAPRSPATPSAGFWMEVGRSVGEGEPIAPGDVESWLQAEGAAGGTMVDKARARLAELRTVQSALHGMVVPPETLTEADVAALDAATSQPPERAAKALKKFIEEGYEARQQGIFLAVEAYLTHHRTPESVSAFLALSQMRTGPKTKSWFQDRFIEVLAGP